MIIEPFFFSLKIPSLHGTLSEDIQRTKLIIYGNHAYSFITRNLEFSKITAPIKDTKSLKKTHQTCAILNDVAVVVQTEPVFKPMNS